MNAEENPACIYGSQMGFTGGGLSAPAYNAVVPATTEIGGGLVVNHHHHLNGNNLVSRKRSRDSLSFLGEDVSSQIYDHMLDVDRLTAQYVIL